MQKEAIEDYYMVKKDLNANYIYVFDMIIVVMDDGINVDIIRQIFQDNYGSYVNVLLMGH